MFRKEREMNGKGNLRSNVKYGVLKITVYSLMEEKVLKMCMENN